jgi:outer membrane lipoprotein SlyB
MRNLTILTILAALALTGCAIGDVKMGGPNYKGQPLSAVTTKLGWPPNQTQTIAGQKVYTWIEGNALAGCQVQVVMAGDVIESYTGSGDVNICAQYDALAGGLKGYPD